MQKDHLSFGFFRRWRSGKPRTGTIIYSISVLVVFPVVSEPVDYDCGGGKKQQCFRSRNNSLCQLSPDFSYVIIFSRGYFKSIAVIEKVSFDRILRNFSENFDVFCEFRRKRAPDVKRPVKNLKYRNTLAITAIIRLLKNKESFRNNLYLGPAFVNAFRADGSLHT